VTLVETVTLRSGRLSVDVLPSRGLDLGGASFDGRRFSWESPIGHVPWQGSFGRSFGGGLVVTCGLGNVGAPSEGQPQHGWYTSLPAGDVRVERDGDRVVARARVVEATTPWDVMELEREIVVDGGVRITDVTRNLGPEPAPAPVLYHCNLRWDEVEIDADDVVPRDADASAHDWRTPGPPGPERVYEHVGARAVRVRGPAGTLRVGSGLPRLWQWIAPSIGALGIEPANCSVLGRAYDRAGGALPYLGPGAERETSVAITPEEA